MGIRRGMTADGGGAVLSHGIIPLGAIIQAVDAFQVVQQDLADQFRLCSKPVQIDRLPPEIRAQPD